MKFALQLYSVRTDLESDFKGTLRKVKEMGYDGVEFAGLYGQNPNEIREYLVSLGLEPAGAHVSLAEMRADIGKVISDYSAVGCRDITVPYLMPEDRPGTPGWERTVADIRDIGEKVTAAGMHLSYHNHDFEFVKIGGEYALDMLYSAVPASLLETELDLCWVRVAGEEPAAYLRKYAGRCRLVHFKDYVGGKQDNMYALIGIEESGKKPDAQAFEFRPLGKGVQNIQLLYKTAAECGAEWIIAEQDEPSMGLSRMECAGVSIKALRAAAE